MSFFLKKNRRSFAWKCFMSEQLLLDLAHLETTIQSTVVYFRAHMRKSTIHHLSRCNRRVSKHRNRIFGAFLSTNRHEPFFEWLTNCMGSNANKFFWQSNVQAIWFHLCLKLSQSHDRSHDDLAISVGAQHQWFPEQQLILDDFHEMRPGVNYDLVRIHHSIDGPWWSFIAKNLIKFIDALLLS